MPHKHKYVDKPRFITQSQYEKEFKDKYKQLNNLMVSEITKKINEVAV